MSEDQTERIRLLMKAALDDAFKLQLGKLYQVWLSNPGDMETARTRAATGADNAIRTYRIAIGALEAWEG
jgi:hypothetical protein